jgi:hypothetical protein
VLRARTPRWLADKYVRGKNNMSERRFVKYAKGHYWLTMTETAEHPQRVFQDRHEAKLWLIKFGVSGPVAEKCLIEAHSGKAVCVLLSEG